MKRLLCASALLIVLSACTQGGASIQGSQSGTANAGTHASPSTQNSHSVIVNSEQGEAKVQYDTSLLLADYAADASGFRSRNYVSPDSTQAADRTRKAAEQGNAVAQNKLGIMYAQGEGVLEDDAQALNWFRKAAEQGDVEAQHNLGNMYANGVGVPVDYSQAMNWYLKAAEQGDAEEQGHVCLSYALGKGVPQDFVLAYAWCNLSASRMHGELGEQADELRHNVSKPLSATERAEAQRLSSNWKEGQSIRRE